ncbi:MAG: polyribonucleotide nucleotidyltransferase [bacterium]
MENGIVHSVRMDLGGRLLTIETGRLAKQADGAALVRYNDTMILASAVADKEPSADLDFFPVVVDYRERAYAAGLFPGGFYKREGRPKDEQIVKARLVDRSLRPLFPKGFYSEVQIMISALSADGENDPDIIAIIGASTALCLSDIPFGGPVAGVRVGMIDNKFILNPTYKQMRESSLNLVVSGTKNAVIMVEAGANELPEETMIDAIRFGHNEIKRIISLQEQLIEQCGAKAKREIAPIVIDDNIERAVREYATDRIGTALMIEDKIKRQEAMEESFHDTIAHFFEEDAEREVDEEVEIKQNKVRAALQNIERELVRNMILRQGKRVDGRRLDEIRPITCEVGILPRAHGSALFTRGQTQSLGSVTLGVESDEQIIETYEGERGELTKKFMFHYNFPPFCTGEVRPIRGPGRREIGHGALAERALQPVIPSPESFPYTIRVVSEILESNGSSSMASVCSGSMALMDAGVPIRAPVAGIAMGLIKEGDAIAILSDIQGLEDHLGDMDFKVAGTDRGVTALQMDIKIEGVDFDIMMRALKQAREGRLFILEKMNSVISHPRPNLSPYAPRVKVMQIDPDKIKDVIGPGGKTIRKIIGDTGVEIDVDDYGTVKIYSRSEEAISKAAEMIEYLTADAEIGRTYLGKVVRITNFGAFVEILPGKDGLLHISQIADRRVNRVEDVLTEGDEVLVKVVDIDDQGKVSLSRKQALRERGGRAKTERIKKADKLVH